MLVLSLLLPIIWGLFILIRPEFKSRKTLITVFLAGLFASAAVGVFSAMGANTELLVFSFGKNLDIYFSIDSIGRLFAMVVTLVWVLSGVFAVEYMKHEKEEKRFFGFYLMVFGVLYALTFSGSMVTYYFFYEMMTLLSVMLILHNRSKEAIMGGLKYLFYSLFGAYMVLFSLFFLNKYAVTLNFTAGGSLDMAAVSGNEKLLLIVAFCGIIGFRKFRGGIPSHRH